MLTYWETLIATRSNIAVNDSYAQLWGRKLSNAYTVETYTGTLPTTLQTVEGYLESYKIYGNTEQTGTPTPENPIMPIGCGVRTENLVDISTAEKGRIDNGKVGYASATTALSVSDGTISFTTNANYRGVCCGFVEIPTGAERLTLRGTFTGEDGIGTKFVFYDSQKTWLNADVIKSATQSSSTAPIPVSAKYVRLSFTTQGASGYTISNLMLNLGSTALPYEPFGYKLPLTSAGQGVDIYLGEVETTRRIKKYVFTGEENGTLYSTGTSRKGIEITGIPGIIGGNADIAILAICTHYQPNTRSVLYRNTDNGISNAFRNDNIIFYDANYQTVEAFQQFCAQQYAAGTPVTVWYVLAEPETGIVNEPLMKIGDYADTTNSTQTSVQIPTAAGETTISWAGEGLAPSEVELVYKVKR